MSRRRARAAAVACVLAAWVAFPGGALAHGPVAPIASSYLARVGTVPDGLQAKVLDGDQRMWLRVAPGAPVVVVLDYRGAPYLRFSRAGVEVNRRSAMYFLNQTPAELPPGGLTAGTPPVWQPVSGGDAYSWHDGRLHALASVALAPGASYAGRWTIPLRLGGRASAITGGLWHAGAPSIVWFWPIVVLLACVLAGRRLRRPGLDARLARVLALAALAAIATAGVARELHGRPTVSVVQLGTLAVVTAFVAWGLRRVLFERPGYFSYFAIAFVAIWQGGELVPTLLEGYVLAAVPAFVARAAAVIALAGGAGLLLLIFRVADETAEETPAGDRAAGKRREPATAPKSLA
ncbi:MAG: hypothetical protein JO168_09095 [Solirubrobacterales bacterium]|nr:hypothetical protein [Solirubrobacterales bacterium]MBV9715524.1 hypothetical protein [Solirubrobacterales bacterium]